MLTVKDWMELVDYQITEGSEYCWRCFGDNAYSLNSWNGDQDGWSFDIVFDTRTQEVYTVDVCDYKHNRAYRMINPDYYQDYLNEAKSRDVNAKEAWDQCDFVDLEEEDDFRQKSLAIKSGNDYDTRVSVPLTIPDDALFALMKQAHELDITLNQLVENIVRKAVADKKIKDHLSDDEYWDQLSNENLQDSDDWRDEDDELASDLEDLRKEYNFNDAVQGNPAQAMKKIKKKKKSKSV